MDITEVENICPIFRDILRETHYIVDGLASVFILGYPFLVIEHHEVGLFFRVGVDPDVYETVDLFGRILSLLGVLSSLNPFHALAVTVGEVLVVFHTFGEGRFFVVIYMEHKIPTHCPVSPSKSQPWKGHWIQVSLTTFPPIPRFAPMWLQYECSA